MPIFLSPGRESQDKSYRDPDPYCSRQGTIYGFEHALQEVFRFALKMTTHKEAANLSSGQDQGCVYRTARASTISTVSARRLEFGSSARADFSKYAAAPSLTSFSSFFCDRLVSTMTGMCMVAGFSFRAFRTFGPLILGSIISSRMMSGRLSLATCNASSPSSAVLTR